MPTAEDIRSWYGRTLHDADGAQIGEIVDVYADRMTGEPEWLSVDSGMMGAIHFVPLRAARGHGDGVQVPYDAATVKHAPRVGDDSGFSPDEERRLYEHYSIDVGDFDGDRAYVAEQPVGRDTGPTTDTAMTRSEEELRVGTRPVESGRARLRKVVVTEDVEMTVPVRREEVRVEREPIIGADVDQALDGPAISEEEHEVTLYAEEPVVEKRVVPKERIRMETDTIVEERRVTDQVRKERIEADGGR